MIHRVFFRETIPTHGGSRTNICQVLTIDLDTCILPPVGYEVRIFRDGKVEEFVVKEGALLVCGSLVNVELIVEKP